MRCCSLKKELSASQVAGLMNWSLCRSSAALMSARIVGAPARRVRPLFQPRDLLVRQAGALADPDMLRPLVARAAEIADAQDDDLALALRQGGTAQHVAGPGVERLRGSRMARQRPEDFDGRPARPHARLQNLALFRRQFVLRDGRDAGRCQAHEHLRVAGGDGANCNAVSPMATRLPKCEACT
jgi:hypothetical protein